MQELTNDYLDRMQALSDAATPGPWTCYEHESPQYTIGPDAENLHCVATTSQRNDAANAALIAEARSFIQVAIPALRHLLYIQQQAVVALARAEETDKQLAALKEEGEKKLAAMQEEHAANLAALRATPRA